MQVYGARLTDRRRIELLGCVEQLVASTDVKQILAAEYVLEPPEAVAVDVATFKLRDGELRLRLSRAQFRPPFEWIAEISIDAERADYFMHYLITTDTVVLANRRELTPIDEPEAQMILATLAEVGPE